MPYEVLVDGLSVLKANDTYKDNDGKVIGYDHVGVIREQGEILEDSEVSPVIQKLYEDGDEHVTSTLKKVSGTAAKKEAAHKEAAPKASSSKSKADDEDDAA